MRSRIVVVGLAIVVALVTGSVLVFGYAAAAASLLIIVTLLVRKVLVGRSGSPSHSPVPRRMDSEDREAA